MGRIVGIDLGTTYSAIAAVDDQGKPVILCNREGERTTPSIVLLDGGTPIVGTIAKQSAVAKPLSVVQFVKRQMGNPSWKFRTESGESFTPEEISAMILKRLKEDAEAALGEPVDQAVITVPAYFSDAQRKATQDAGRIAGLNVRRIINEPTAAALAYAFETFRKRIVPGQNGALHHLDQEQVIAVYDLGGGTFDVTIMRLRTGDVEVIATGGDKNLGGFDWDNELMNFLNGEFKKQGGTDLYDDPEFEQQLRDRAEIAKKTLSSRDKANVLLVAQGKTASIPVTRDQFEAMTASLLKRTANIMEAVLDDADLRWSDIEKVLLTGGSTRMKAVPALVERLTGKAASTELHPDEVVAMGAAVQAVMLDVQESKAAPPKNFPIVRVNDVTARGMGVVALDENGKDANSIILPRNTPYGQEYSGEYSTSVDRQETILLQVTEGDDDDLSYVTIIIEHPIPIPRYPKGAEIRITMQWDLSGMVHVGIFDMTAGKPLKKLEIPRKANMSAHDVEDRRLKLSTREVN